jgi:glycosyltransferase involved in cell wall biosynthesis
MNILHISAHLGDGAGKAISGLAIADKENRHSIFLLDEPRKFNHIDNCRANDVRVVVNGDIAAEITNADVIILSWWSNPLTDKFIADFPQILCRVVLWMHKNGIYDPPIPCAYLDIADAVMVTTPFSRSQERLNDAALVYGFGNFDPQSFLCKANYALTSDKFIIGYVGSPAYKKLPRNFIDYCRAAIEVIQTVKFILVGETDIEIQRDIVESGLADYFDVRGWCANAEEMLLGFDVFGYLLRPDTFATTENALLEAFAAGLPVVMSQEPLGKYFIENGKTGFLADSPAQYAEIMSLLFTNANLRERIGRAGREHCIAKFNAANNIARFNETIWKVRKFE